MFGMIDCTLVPRAPVPILNALTCFCKDVYNFRSSKGWSSMKVSIYRYQRQDHHHRQKESCEMCLYSARLSASFSQPAMVFEN